MPANASPCDTCAFRKGSVTHEAEPQNRLRGEIAVLGPLPFHCHHSPAGDWSDTHIADETREDRLFLRRELPLCAGWRREVRERAAAGYYKGLLHGVRRYLAAHCLKLIDDFVRGEGEVKENALRELPEALALLWGKPRKKGSGLRVAQARRED